MNGQQQNPQNSQSNEALQRPVQLTLTIAQVNSVLTVLNQGPYQTVKPLIELIIDQAQAYINQQAVTPAHQTQATQQPVQTPLQSVNLPSQ